MKILVRKINIPALIILLFISLVGYLSLKNTLGFYFYSDDYAVLYHHINNLTYFPPFYTYVPKFYGWIYDLFGLNPKPYFVLAIISHIIASFSLFFYTYKLTKQKPIALFASLIFSTGYIGLESFSQMNTATIDSGNVFFTIVMLIFQKQFLETKKIKYYLFTLLVFYLGLILFPFRAFQMIMFLFFADLVLTFRWSGFKDSLIWLYDIIKRNTPFLGIYFLLGIGEYGGNYLGKFITNYNSELERLFFSIPGNMVLPSSIVSNIPREVVGLFLSIIVLVIVFAIKKHADLSKGLLLSLVFTHAGFIGFFILLPTFDANAEVNRYLTLSFASFSMMVSILIYTLILSFSEQKKVILYLIFIIPYVIFLANLSFNYQKSFVEDRSIHAEKIFTDLKNYVPAIDPDKTNIFYFEVFQESEIIVRFGTSIQVAYMDPRASLATHYRVPIEKIVLIYDEEEYKKRLDHLKDDEVIYEFHYDKDGLHKTLYNNQI